MNHQPSELEKFDLRQKSLTLLGKNSLAYKYLARISSHCTFNQSVLGETMPHTEEALEKIQADKRKMDELKQMHRCFGARCIVCSSLFNPALRYLISKEKNATCN